MPMETPVLNVEHYYGKRRGAKRTLGRYKQHCKFRIHAIDKNPTSVRSLRYQQNWTNPKIIMKQRLFECDMRAWRSDVKADIEATEIPSSLSEIKLSPECTDGVSKIPSMTVSILG